MQENPNDPTTYFGYKKVKAHEKNSLVETVFRSVAPKYDLMNDLMSMGMHRLWKRQALSLAAPRVGQRILDTAAGTCDMTKLFAQRVGQSGQVIASDINDAMLNRGRDSLIDEGFLSNIAYVQANAEQLPFIDNYFDCIMIAFGLRNVTHKEMALRDFYRVLKPGGRLVILEFSRPHGQVLKKLYDFYSFNVIPKIGAWVAKDRDSYAYLVESIRMHPDQESLKSFMTDSGFDEVQYHNLNGGIVALHRGYKY